MATVANIKSDDQKDEHHNGANPMFKDLNFNKTLRQMWKNH